MRIYSFCMAFSLFSSPSLFSFFSLSLARIFLMRFLQAYRKSSCRLNNSPLAACTVEPQTSLRPPPLAFCHFYLTPSLSLCFPCTFSSLLRPVLWYSSTHFERAPHDVSTIPAVPWKSHTVPLANLRLVNQSHSTSRSISYPHPFDLRTKKQIPPLLTTSQIIR